MVELRLLYLDLGVPEMEHQAEIQSPGHLQRESKISGQFLDREGRENVEITSV